MPHLGFPACFVGVFVMAAAMLPAQTITFAQFSDLQSFSSFPALTDAERDARALERQYALAWAVTEVNRTVRAGKRIDCLVITGGFGLKGINPGSLQQELQERLRPLRAAMVPSVYVLPGEDDIDLDSKDPFHRYHDLFTGLKALLSNKEVHDLTGDAPVLSRIQVLGLNSATFGNPPSGNAAVSSALNEIARLRQLADGRSSVVFTHLPDLDDPTQVGRGKADAATWRISSAARAAWERLLAQREILAVFAAHVQTPVRSVYFKDYTYALNKPSPLLVAKTWLVPPLAAAGTARSETLLGFQTATVAEDGSVSVSVNWFSPPAPGAEFADKAEKITEAHAYEQADDLEKAAAAYQQALSSKDAWVRGAASAGFQRIVRREKDLHWASVAESRLLGFIAKWWLDIVLVLGIVLLLAVAEWWGGISYRLAKGLRKIRGKPFVVIGPIVKGNEAAPIEEFTIQLQLAIEDIQSTLDPEPVPAGTSGLAPVAVPLGGGWRILWVSAGTKVASPPTAEDLPELKIAGVELRTVLAWLRALKNLLCRRIEIQVCGSNARLQVFAVQRFAWIEEDRWTVPPPGSSANVVEASRRLACCIMGQEYIR